MWWSKYYLQNHSSVEVQTLQTHKTIKVFKKCFTIKKLKNVINQPKKTGGRTWWITKCIIVVYIFKFNYLQENVWIAILQAKWLDMNIWYSFYYSLRWRFLTYFILEMEFDEGMEFLSVYFLVFVWQYGWPLQYKIWYSGQNFIIIINNKIDFTVLFQHLTNKLFLWCFHNKSQ